MKRIHAYCRLMRFHQPIGILLLWAPTASALWIAHRGAPPLTLLLYFLVGTIAMRAAGCVINDIADRHIDKHVARTKKRPLTAGDIQLVEAFGILLLCLFIAALVVIQLPPFCFAESLGALLVALIYPFCKRYIEAPQLVLGIAFSMGIPMAYTALGVAPDAFMWLLFLTNTLWILMYDTIYAMIDRDDDRLIGVKSTAILCASHERLVIGMLQTMVHGLWLLFGLLLHQGVWFYSAWLMGLFIMCYQQYRIARHAYFQAFAISGLYGIVMWIGLY